jgi:hypothetical protein
MENYYEAAKKNRTAGAVSLRSTAGADGTRSYKGFKKSPLSKGDLGGLFMFH